MEWLRGFEFSFYVRHALNLSVLYLQMEPGPARAPFAWIVWVVADSCCKF